IDQGYNKAGFSNFGPTVDLCAPGVANLSTIPQITSSATWASASHGARLLTGSNFTGTATANAVYCGFGGAAEDFPPSVAGNFAHVRRRGTDAQGNTLSFRTKTDNAVAAGAIGVIISNDSGGLFSGNLNGTFSIPVVSISQSDGNDLQNVNNNTSVTISVAQTGHTYASYSGTSMACPHAAGVAGLMIGIYGQALSANALEDALKAAAQDLGDPGRDDLFGFGLVRADLTKAYLDINLPDCPVDYNNDGFLEPGDLDEFITDYFSVPVGISSDFNGDGFVEPGDLDEFITRYFEGC
ncbi:MAG: S8 family serine peptidase, partial [Phycisphaerales bacterium]